MPQKQALSVPTYLRDELKELHCALQKSLEVLRAEAAATPRQRAASEYDPRAMALEELACRHIDSAGIECTRILKRWAEVDLSVRVDILSATMAEAYQAVMGDAGRSGSKDLVNSFFEHRGKLYADQLSGVVDHAHAEHVRLLNDSVTQLGSIDKWLALNPSVRRTQFFDYKAGNITDRISISKLAEVELAIRTTAESLGLA